MSPKVTVSVPEELHTRMEKWREAFNFSRIFQEAVEKAINAKESFQKRIREEDPKMEEIIERLKKEKREITELRFEAGKDEGLDFAKNAHYEVLREAANWKQYLSGDKIQALYEDSGWDVDEETFGEDLAFLKDMYWLNGFRAAVSEFWEEVESKI